MAIGVTAAFEEILALAMSKVHGKEYEGDCAHKKAKISKV